MPGLTSRRQSGSHWIGYLCPMGEKAKCYAYATATNVKIIAMASNISEPKLKVLFSTIHDHYVKYAIMNPFSKIGGPIKSKKFSQRVEEDVQVFNDAYS